MHKPDLCAPSGFHEDDDSALLNTGTSAAAAVAAGVVAALRSFEHFRGAPYVAPAEMRDLLRESARREQGQDWDPRLGYGVIDCQRALAELKRRRALHGYP